MKIVVQTVESVPIAVVQSEDVLVTDVQTALDLMATVRYETDCDRMVVFQSALDPAFFDLSTRLAGEVLQKFVTYSMKFAVVGDFADVKSKSLRDFIYESNQGKHVFFAQSEEEALRRLARA